MALEDLSVMKKDKTQIRVERLKALCDQVGGQKKLVAMMQSHDDKPINPSYLSQVINGYSSFGEKAAAKMALNLGLDADYFDRAEDESPPPTERQLQVSSTSVEIPVLAAVGSMGEGDDLVYEADQIIDNLIISKDWLSLNIKSAPKNLRVITGAGDSMAPTFNHGDILMVDISKSNPDVDGVYVLSAHNRLFIKRVRQRLDGSFEVSSDNPNVKTVDVLDGRGEVTVHGRVVWAWNGKTL